MPDVIILAGLQLIKNSDCHVNKALFRINGKAMIDYVIEALRKTAKVEKIVVVGPESELEGSLKGKVDAVIDSNGSILENLAQGIRYLGTDRNILVCSSDIPMITPEAIDDFISMSETMKADLCYPIVEKAVNDKKFPFAKRTYAKVSGKKYTGGNVFYLNPQILENTYTLAKKLINARKKPLKMAKILGIGFAVKFILGCLNLDKIEKKFCDISKIKARVVISEYPEIGNDVDKNSDVTTAIDYFRRTKSKTI